MGLRYREVPVNAGWSGESEMGKCVDVG